MSDDYDWDDLPGSQLSSRAEAIDFTAVRRVNEVRVVYDEEYAYSTDENDVGSFQAGFLDSTISEDGKTVSLKRTGGWNRKVRVYPEMEPAPAATGGLAMGAIYALDLTAQPSQTMTAAGSYTIDGKTWWAKGALASGSCALVNGSGLSLYKSAADANDGWRNRNETFADRLMSFACSQLADYNPLAPLAIEWRFASPVALSGAGNEVPCAGVINVAASSAACTAAEKGTCTALSRQSPSAALWDPDPRVNLSATIAPTGVSTAYGDYVQGIHRFSARRYYPLLGAYTGSIGVPEDYQAFDPALVPAFAGQSIVDSSTSFFYCLHKPFVGTALDIYLTHLKVLQPRVP